MYVYSWWMGVICGHDIDPYITNVVCPMKGCLILTIKQLFFSVHVPKKENIHLLELKIDFIL